MGLACKRHWKLITNDVLQSPYKTMSRSLLEESVPSATYNIARLTRTTRREAAMGKSAAQKQRFIITSFDTHPLLSGEPSSRSAWQAFCEDVGGKSGSSIAECKKVNTQTMLDTYRELC